MENISPSDEVRTRDFALRTEVEGAPQPDEHTLLRSEGQNASGIAARRQVTRGELQTLHTEATSPRRIQRSSTDGLWDTPAMSAKTTPAAIFGYRESQHIPEFCDSVVDRVSKRIKERQRPSEPDKFENYLRGHVEARMADVYQSLSDKPATKFENLFYFGILDRGKDVCVLDSPAMC